MNDNKLEFICMEGEGQYIEFKEKPDRSLASEMVAFSSYAKYESTMKSLKIPQSNRNFHDLQMQAAARYLSA